MFHAFPDADDTCMLKGKEIAEKASHHGGENRFLIFRILTGNKRIFIGKKKTLPHIFVPETVRQQFI